MKRLSEDSYWVPTLYFTQGLPFAVVSFLAAIVYKEFGVNNGLIALVTSLLGLPWMLKPFWSPLLEIIATKKTWIIRTQVSMAVLLFLLAISFSFFGNWFFSISIILFIGLAISSATFDIASDGYYLLNLDMQKQAFYVGVRTLFYQLARLFCAGGIVMLIGWVQRDLSRAVAWNVGFGLIAFVMGLFTIYHLIILRETEKPKNARFIDFFAIARVFSKVFNSFFALKGIILLIIFLLIYNAAESQLLKIVPLFLLDGVQNGGLGLNATAVGFIFGFLGTAAMMVGAMVSGWLMQKYSCARVLIPITLILSIVNCGYLIMDSFQIRELYLVALIVILAQLGFGLASGVYMAFLMNLFSKQKYFTSYYAFGTAIMAVGMTVFGICSGYLQLWLAYKYFFWWIAIFGGMIFIFTQIASKKIIKTYFAD